MQRFNEPPRTPSPSPPRTGILRQPTISSFAPFRRDDDMRQLMRLYTDIRNLVLQDIEFSIVQTAVDNLEGHQDIKDMFAGIDDLDFIPGTRRLLDILELIDNKTDALDALDDLEAVSGSLSAEVSLADAATESETETEVESEDELAPPPLSRRLIFTETDDTESTDEDDRDIVDLDTEPQSLRF